MRVPEHQVALYQAPHRPHPARPTGHEQHTVVPLPGPAKFVRIGVQPYRLHLGPGKAIPKVRYVKLEPVRLQVVARTERVVEKVTVVFIPEACRGAHHHHRRQHLDVAQLPKQGSARVMPPDESRRVQVPQVCPDPQV